MELTSLPAFFKDQSESYKVEEVIDYFMSWTLRCADDVFRDFGLVHEYAKRILNKLLFDDENHSQRVFKDIKVWKQWANIDLWVEVSVENDKNYVIIIETKMYSSIRDGQLGGYKEIAEAYCAINRVGYERKYLVLRPDYDHEEKYNEKNICKDNHNYDHYNLYQLQKLLTDDITGNALFDEFWFNWSNFSSTQD